MSKKTQNQEAFERFMANYLAQAEQKDQMRRAGWWALVSLMLMLLAFSIWQTVFSAIHRPEEQLSNYQGEYYQKQALLRVKQKLYTAKAPHTVVDTVKEAMTAKWLADSVRNKDYPYRIELPDGRIVRVVFAYWIKIPHIAFEERMAQAAWPSFSAVLAGLGQGDYGNIEPMPSLFCRMQAKLGFMPGTASCCWFG
jgi:hypothetical protein